MSVQKSILSFFKPGVTSSKVNPLKGGQCSPHKKFKTSSNNFELNIDSKRDDIKELSSDKTSHKFDEVSKNCVKLNNKDNKKESNILAGEVTDAPVYSEEKREIEKRRLQAKLKLLSKKYAILDPGMDPTWVAPLEKEFSKPYFQKLNDFVINERKTKTIYPPPDQVWTWTKLCPLDEIKVVIIGQDPYHNPGQAHGLCFSVPVGVPIPPSLYNIYKELQENFQGINIPNHGYLMGWAMQGVLLLNAVLTVEANKPNSHKDKGWEHVTTAVIKHLNDNCTGIVFLLWGSYAQKKADFVDTKKHHVLKSVHPSPLSAHRGFFGCKHFYKCNQLLLKQDMIPINWEWLPKAEDVSGDYNDVSAFRGHYRINSRDEEMFKPFRITTPSSKTNEQ